MEEKIKYLLDKIISLYLRYGIRSVTMDDVAREAGISKKTLYQHFKDKEDLVEKAMEYLMNEKTYSLSKHENAIDALISLRNHVAKVIKQFNNNLEFDLKKYYPSLYEKIKSFKRNQIYNDTIYNLKQGIKEGLYREKIDVEFVSKLQVGRILCTMHPDNAIFDETEVVSLSIFDKALDYHLRAICTEEGLKYFYKQLNKIKDEEIN